MTRVIAFFLLIFALTTPPKASAQDALRIAAVVNDEIISVYDLGARISLIASTSGLPNTQETAQRLAPRILRTMIDEKLKRQEADRLDITVTPTELNHGLAQIERNNGLPPGGIDDFLESKGLTKETLIDQVESEIIWIKVVNASIRPTVKIANDEIEEALATIKNNQGKPEYRIAEIFLAANNPKREAEAEAFATRLIEQIRSGAKFEALARSFSDAPTAPNGGDMGWLGIDQLDSESRLVVAGLKPGEVSQPFKSLGGYHILFLQGQRTARGLAEDTGMVTLEQAFLPLGSNPSPDEVARQQDAARTLTAGADTCEALHEAGLKTGSPLSGSLGRIQVKNLPPAIANVVIKQPLFTPSDPIRVEGGVAVLMVCERLEGPGGLEDTRRAIITQLTNQHLAIKAEKRLRDIRRAAFLDVRL